MHKVGEAQETLAKLFSALRGTEGGSSGYLLKDFTLHDAISDIEQLQQNLRQAGYDRADAIKQLNEKVTELENARRGFETFTSSYKRSVLKLKAKVAKWKHRASKFAARVRTLEGED